MGLLSSFTNWLVGDVVKPLGESPHPEFQTISNYIGLLLRSLIPVSFVMMFFVGISAIRWFSFDSLSLDMKLDGQTLANYVGIAFGTVVALAGSLVAILLATRAQQTSDETKKLQESANRLAEIANRLAEGERPEYEKAFEAATSYAEFKANIVLFPMTLRRLQRNGKLGDGALIDFNQKSDEMAELQSSLAAALLKSALVSILPALALRTAGNEISQRLIEARIAAVKDSDHLILSIDAGLKLSQAIDELVGEIAESIMHGEERGDSYRTYLDRCKKDHLSELEFWFVRHVLQYTQINRGIDFPHDIGPWRDKALANVTGGFTRKKSIKDFSSECLDATKPFVTLGFDDSALYLVQRELSVAAKNAGIEHQVHVAAQQWEVQFAEVIRKVQAAKEEGNKKRTFLMLDQVDIYKDSFDPSESSKFNLTQHIRFWFLCKIYDEYLELLDALWQKEKLAENIENVPYDWLKNIQFKLRSDVLWETDDSLPPDNGTEVDIPDFLGGKLYRTWGGWLGGKQEDQVDEIISTSAAGVGLERPELFMDRPTLSFALNTFLLKAVASSSEFVSTAADQIKESISTSTTLCEISVNDRKMLGELARIPFFQRPVYGWHSGGMGFLEPVPKVTSADLGVISNVYVNAEMKINSSLVLKWLIEASREKGGRSVVYWF